MPQAPTLLSVLVWDADGGKVAPQKAPNNFGPSRLFPFSNSRVHALSPPSRHPWENKLLCHCFHSVSDPLRCFLILFWPETLVAGCFSRRLRVLFAQRCATAPSSAFVSLWESFVPPEATSNARNYIIVYLYSKHTRRSPCISRGATLQHRALIFKRNTLQSLIKFLWRGLTMRRMQEAEKDERRKVALFLLYFLFVFGNFEINWKPRPVHFRCRWLIYIHTYTQSLLITWACILITSLCSEALPDNSGKY